MLRRLLIFVAVLLVLATAGGLFAFQKIKARMGEELGRAGVSADIRLQRQGAFLHNLALERRGLELRCDEVRVWAPWGELLRNRQAQRPNVEIDRCTLRGALTASDNTGVLNADALDVQAPEEPLSPRVSVELERALGRLGELHLRELEVDLQTARPVRGTLQNLRGRGSSRRFEASWSGDTPLPWTTSVAFELQAGALVVQFPTPLRIGRYALQIGAIHLAQGEAPRATDLELIHPDGDRLTVDALSLPDRSRLLLEGVRGQLPARFSPLQAQTLPGEPATEDAPGAQADAAERTPDEVVPPQDAKGQPFDFNALLNPIVGLPMAFDALRDKAQEAAARLPIAIEISDFEVDDVPLCESLSGERLLVTAQGAEGQIRCLGMEFDFDFPFDADLPTSLVARGFELSHLHGAVGGQVDARLSLQQQEEALTLVATGDLRGLSWDNSAVADTQIDRIDLHFELRGSVAAAALHLEGELGMGSAPLDFSLAAQPLDSADWALTFEGGVSHELACQVLWEAIPGALLPNLRGANLRFQGNAAPRISLQMRSSEPESFRAAFQGFMGDCSISRIGRDFDPKRLNSPDFKHEIEIDEETRIEVGPGSGSWVPLDVLPAWVPALMYLSEEIAFFTNPGFSTTLIQRAVRMNLREGRYVYGGSTVSQQLVKNLFFTRDKTLSRKLEEAIIVWAMEQWVSKQRILELYLNCIEFGRGIWGIDAAARHYFEVPAHKLTPLQAAFLAALKPAPWIGETYRQRGTTPATGWWPRRIELLIHRLVEYGPYLPAEMLETMGPWVVRFPGNDAAPANLERGAGMELIAAAQEDAPASQVLSRASLIELRQQLGQPLGATPRLTLDY